MIENDEIVRDLSELGFEGNLQVAVARRIEPIDPMQGSLSGAIGEFDEVTSLVLTRGITNMSANLFEFNIDDDLIFISEDSKSLNMHSLFSNIIKAFRNGNYIHRDADWEKSSLGVDRLVDKIEPVDIVKCFSLSGVDDGTDMFNSLAGVIKRKYWEPKNNTVLTVKLEIGHINKGKLWKLSKKYARGKI